VNSKREFRKLKFGRKLDVKRLRAALSRTRREELKNPSPQAALVRVESILIKADETTVFLSGNRPGLDAVVVALRSTFSNIKTSEASRDEAGRPPRVSASPPRVRR
jgi:hypothetical protein